MERIKNFLFSLLTSGKYSGVQDEKDMDAAIRLIVLNITYTITSVLILGIGASDMRSGHIDQGLLELIIGSLILVNLLLLRTEFPFMVGGVIIIVVYGFFCATSIFSKVICMAFPPCGFLHSRLCRFLPLDFPSGSSRRLCCSLLQ